MMFLGPRGGREFTDSRPTLDFLVAIEGVVCPAERPLPSFKLPSFTDTIGHHLELFAGRDCGMETSFEPKSHLKISTVFEYRCTSPL